MLPTAQRLDALETAGLLQLAQTAPEMEYLFRHALVQDAAYQSLLLADRRQFHATIGETLERLYPDRLDELAGELGRRFAAANAPARALPYFIQAAEQASAAFANEEAIALYSQALTIARDLEIEDDKLAALCKKLGRTLEITSAYSRALTHYQEMENFALQRGYKRLELTAVIGQTTLYTTPTAVNDTAIGAVYAQRAIALAKELDDQPAHLRILWNLLNLYAFENNMEKAFAVGEEALTLAKKQGLRESEAYIVNDLGRQYAFVCNLRRAASLAEQARRLWSELDNLPMLADSLALSSSIANERGQFQRALIFSNEGVELGISTNNFQAQAYNLIMAGSPHLYLGRIDKSLDVLTTCLQYARQINFVPIQIFALAYLAHVYLHCGDLRRGAAAAQAAYQLANTEFPRALMAGLSVRALAQALLGECLKTKEIVAEAKANGGYKSQAIFSPWVMEAEIRILLYEGNAEAALAASTILWATLENFGNLANIPIVSLLQGQALAALGRWDEARQAAEMGMQTAVSTHNRFVHWQLAAFQAQLQTQQGNREEAETLRREAETIVNEIAARCPPDLQEIFLNMSEVTAVLRPQQL